MKNILVYVESRFPVSKKFIRNIVNTYLDGVGIQSTVEISLAIVGDRKMKDLNTKYHKENTTTTVLSFPLENVFSKDQSKGKGFIYPPDNTLRLGDIIISYPQAVARAGEDNMLVADKLKQLIIHGLDNLMGNTAR